MKTKNIKCLRLFVGVNSNLYSSIIEKSSQNIKMNTPLEKNMIK